MTTTTTNYKGNGCLPGCLIILGLWLLIALVAGVIIHLSARVNDDLGITPAPAKLRLPFARVTCFNLPCQGVDSSVDKKQRGLTYGDGEGWTRTAAGTRS